jgi:membrane-associated phospholipid phosphatase
MPHVTIRPTQIDKDVARAIARHFDPRIEQSAEALTWGADEHALIAAAAVAWLLTRQSNEPVRRLTTHVLACSLAAAVLPHLMKDVIDQERPDRLTIRGHWRGVPWSGNSTDAFPSGHALHVGALASAATLLPAKARDLVWAVGTVLVATRVVLLAHWLTDVLAGLGLGIALERVMRWLTRPIPIRAGHRTRTRGLATRESR